MMILPLTPVISILIHSSFTAADFLSPCPQYFYFASLEIKTSNTQKLGMIEVVPFGRSIVSPRVKRWLCFCFKNSRNYLLMNMLCVHPVQAETEARSRRQQMNWCEGKLGLILSPLASYFPYTLNKRRTRTFCSLWEPWGQPVTQEAGSVPESPRLWPQALGWW